jgi:hypothetical protein
VKKSGSSRGLRGGSFNNYENNLRASNRNNNDPTNENNNIGFRVARPLKKVHAFPTVRSWRCECRHAVPGSGTSRMSRAVVETHTGQIGKTSEAVGSLSEGRLRQFSPLTPVPERELAPPAKSRMVDPA